MSYHGGAPRVRRNRNLQTGAPKVYGVEINGELLINKVVDAVISAGVAYVISKSF